MDKLIFKKVTELWQWSFRRVAVNILQLRRALSRVKWTSWVLLGLFIALVTGSFYGASFLVDLLYDSEIAKIIDRQTLILLLATPAVLVTTSLGILVKLFIERIRQEPGTSLRFRVITLFSIALILPTLIFIFFFDSLFDLTINRTLGNELLVINLENNVRHYQGEIAELQRENETRLLERINNPPKIYNENNNTNKDDNVSEPSQEIPKLDLFMVFNAQSVPIVIEKNPQITLKNYPIFNFTEEVPTGTTLFSSYEKTRGFVYTLYQEDHPPSINQEASRKPLRYIAGITFVPPQLKAEIENTLEVINQFKQFELLIKPFRSLSLAILIYLNIQIFSLTMIIFYYRSNKYLIPIGELIRTLRTASDFTLEDVESFQESLKSEARLTNQIKRLQGNEIGELLQAFQYMKRQSRRNRRRLGEVLELKGWKEAATQVAHEIKNPLTPILLSVNEIKNKLIRKNFLLYEELNDAFNLIESEIARISNLLNDFAAFSKEWTLEQTSIRTDVLLKKLMLQLRHFKDITFRVKNGGSPKLYADEDKIYRVLVNLSQNAVESLQLTEREDKILEIYTRTLYLEETPYYEFEFRDNGKGISPNIRETLFKPYTTNKKTGTGLGLTICKQIALAHEGDVFTHTSQSMQPSGWTSFFLRIPLKNPPQAKPSSESVQPLEISSK